MSDSDTFDAACFFKWPVSEQLPPEMSTDVVLREEKKELPALYYLIKDAVLLSWS